MLAKSVENLGCLVDKFFVNWDSSKGILGAKMRVHLGRSAERASHFEGSCARMGYPPQNLDLIMLMAAGKCLSTENAFLGRSCF